MRRSRFLPCATAAMVMVGLVSGCSRGPSEADLKKAAFEEQLTTLQQQFQDLQQTRADLATAEATLAEIEAVKPRDRTDEQKAELETLPGTVEELVAARETAYDVVQGTLADFLNIALNEFPDDPATVEGLNLYSDEAIMVAEDTVLKSGDYKKAIDHLDSAASYYESIGLPPYEPLTKEIAKLDDMRYVTQERFDLITKNMTKDEVMEVVGVPYYQNVQIDEKRGVETWLYRKRDGGAAGVYFKTNNNKVYNKNFDAVKIKVVED
jgi:hypothetical protein